MMPTGGVTSDGSPIPPSSSSSSGRSRNTGAIIGGVIGGLLMLALMVLLIWFLNRRKRSAHAPLDGSVDDFEKSESEPSTIVGAAPAVFRQGSGPRTEKQSKLISLVYRTP
jgi:hypothetical protein